MTAETPRRNVQTRRLWMCRYVLMIAANLLLCVAAKAGVLRGKVVYAGHVLPGVQITAHSEDKTESIISNSAGEFQFAVLADGSWQIEVTMQCFEKLHIEVTVAPDTKPLQLDR